MLINRIHAEWPFFMSSLSLGLHDGNAWIGGISIRANVPFGAPDPDGWRDSIASFQHKSDYTLEQARQILPAADQIQWDPTLHDGMGQFEYRATSGPLKIWLTVPNSAFPGDASDQQKADVQRILDALKADIWS